MSNETNKSTENGEIYHGDGTVSFPIEIDDDIFLYVAKQAHDRDITFNKMVELILAEAIDREQSTNQA